MLAHRLISLFLVLAVCLETSTAQELRLRTFRKSPSITEVISLNDTGTVLGRYETVQAGLLEFQNFVLQDGHERKISVPDGFTHAEPLRLNHVNEVVGFITRPVGSKNGNQRGAVWNKSSLHILPPPPSYRDSSAHDISHDGRIVSGIAIGKDPPRVVPCIWYRRKRDQWHPVELPCPERYNPLLVTAHVVLSDDGRRAAGSVVTQKSGARMSYGVYYWSQKNRLDDWSSTLVLNRAVHLADITNHGLGVGRVLEQGHRRAFVLSAKGDGKLLPLGSDHQTSYATDVNNQGQVVGFSESPPGPDGTMTAFTWQNDVTFPLPLPKDVVASTANTITDNGRIGGLMQRSASTVEGYEIQWTPNVADDQSAATTTSPTKTD